MPCGVRISVCLAAAVPLVLPPAGGQLCAGTRPATTRTCVSQECPNKCKHTCPLSDQVNFDGSRAALLLHAPCGAHLFMRARTCEYWVRRRNLFEDPVALLGTLSPSALHLHALSDTPARACKMRAQDATREPV